MHAARGTFSVPGGRPVEVGLLLPTREAVIFGDSDSVRNWIAGFVAAGAEHVVIRPTSTIDDATQLNRLHARLSN